MKIFEQEKELESRGSEILGKNSFFFNCHPEVSCFNKCCRNLNLFLYPHDIIMLRKKLEISSGDFIEKYTDLVLRENSYFPDVVLRMADNESQTCPFLSSKGCSVYEARPDSCRNFPVEHGVKYDEKGDIEKEVHLFRPPDFCQGQFEKKKHTLDSWKKDQSAEFTNEMTMRWSEIAKYFYSDIWNGEGPYGQKGKMVFMAAYNIDSFREFVFKSSFLKRYKVKKNIQSKIRLKDESMLKFSFDWIAFFLFAKKSRYIQIR
ncbi:MAG: hypothetical protein CSA18_00295 [Deltaproteobacteria bacterium]|nr:MAG: hypothetical protein CSA18_00295 [Deltaproteobacteria bacterium]